MIKKTIKYTFFGLIQTICFTAITVLLLIKTRENLPVDFNGYIKYIWFLIISADCAVAFFAAKIIAPWLIKKFQIGVRISSRTVASILSSVLAVCVILSYFTKVHLNSALYVIFLYDLFAFFVLAFVVYFVIFIIEYHKI